MFPDTITIYHHDVVGDQDVYTKQVVKGFYIYGKTEIVASGKGAELMKIFNIISHPRRVRDYGTAWTVAEGDRVVRGVGKDISAFKELTDSYTVMSVEVNNCGSDCDHVLIVTK